MILFIIFDPRARNLTWRSTVGVFIFLAFGIPLRVKSQTCSECNGQYIKTVNTTTGECISCFPCPRCNDGYTSSVPCGTTVPFGTEIKCVLIQSDPVVFPLASTQTRHLNSLPLSISSKFIVAPATSIVHLAASSSSSIRSSIKRRDRSDTTKKQKREKELSLEEWKKDSSIYIFGGVFLAVALVAVMYRISRRRSRKQLQPHPVDIRPDPTLPAESSSDVLSEDSETCSIDWATNSVAFRRRNDCTSKTEDGNQRSQCGATQGSAEGKSKSSELVAVPVDDVPPHTQSVPPVPFSRPSIVRDSAIADGMEQGRPITWSELSQGEKYNTKVLEMPYPLLYKICLTLDIPRADGNDVRMLAYKLGISLADLAVLKQAAITQQPDNSYFNSTSCVVLTKNHSLLVKDFVGLMEGIERDDIIWLVNSWSN